MTFEEAHAVFILHHVERRTGERKGRLVRGHNEAERLFCRNVWWPVRGSFDDLHPEYEVRDWRGMSYFCDFVWLTHPVKLVIEIKGFGPHVRDMDRQKYCIELNRETFLTAMGYQVISFAMTTCPSVPRFARPCCAWCSAAIKRSQVLQSVWQYWKRRSFVLHAVCHAPCVRLT
jgi:very-short-patch-repair endonuclease